MILAYHEIIPSKEWWHNPLITDKYGSTVAIYIAEYCK